ncbi:YicC family protein [bacterium K02(2017)]|nr:YicC family protein [bacterium K02(2017)]
MISMTGMGKASGKVLDVPIRIEIKAVNHRHCDIHFRAPLKYAALELQVQQLVKSKLTRGRIDIFVTEEKTVDLSGVEKHALEAYYNYLKHIKGFLNLNEEISLSQLLSGVNSWIQKEVDTKSAWKDFSLLISTAIDDLVKMRQAEGARLHEDLKERLLSIDNIRGQISDKSESIKPILEEKLKQRILDKAEELKELDPQRLSTEVMYYLDRMEITEELDRIKSHVKQMGDFLNSEHPIGRKIDFLLQEFNREFNTITSKCGEPEVSYLVVDAKSELERMREQIQNIE